jgi:cell shape-determining protein MreC
MTLTFEQMLMFLYMLVAVMLIIVLYHAIFIVVDLRKISRRVEQTTNELQAVIMKPVSVADQIMDYVLDLVNQKKKDHKKSHSVDAE